MVRQYNPLPPLDEIRSLVSYDPGAGCLVWKSRAGKNNWNRQHAGKAAGLGGVTPRGHLQVKLCGKLYYVHRVIWALFHGEDLPLDKQIDHINMDPKDNRIENLRVADQSHNRANMRGASGRIYNLPKGVYRTQRGTFQASIRKNRKAHYLGTFSCPHKAHEAYVKAAQDLFGAFARGG